MRTRIISLADVAPTPWKNGGGTTRELFTWPNATEWCARLSVAEIARDGPFSPFPNVDRWFCVLTGRGVQLGDDERHVVVGDPPVYFAGESAPACALIDGGTTDLNWMVRRDCATGGMVRVRDLPVHGGSARTFALTHPGTALCVVYTQNESRVRINGGAASIVVPDQSALIVETSDESFSLAISSDSVQTYVCYARMHEQLTT